jgi:hypothetical protein
LTCQASGTFLLGRLDYILLLSNIVIVYLKPATVIVVEVIAKPSFRQQKEQQLL